VVNWRYRLARWYWDMMASYSHVHNEWKYDRKPDLFILTCQRCGVVQYIGRDPRARFLLE
jgi:hypothetical protein